MKYSNELYLKHKDKIKDLLNKKFNELTNRYEFYDITNDDIDYKPYDGYIPFTNSGYEISGFTDLYNNWIEDKGFTIDDNFYETLEKELTQIVEKMK